MDYQDIVNNIAAAACVVSVKKNADGNCGEVRIVTGNRKYLDTIEKPMGGLEMLTKTFTPNSLYTEYLTRDLNFEESCFQAAVNGKCLHAYAHPARYDVWFNMSFVPLASAENSDLGYCLYIMEVNLRPDAKRMSNISADTASAVLETCIKLRSPDDFKVTMRTVCEDIRELCDSEHCCVLLMDTAERHCSVLCEAFSKDTKLLPMDNYVDDAFYDIAESWIDTIGGSNCLIIKNAHDMEVVRERNPVWVESISSAGGKTIVLFPLEFKNELLGFIWAINFRSEFADKIKETLELTTFILASELYSFRLVDKLNILSSKDMLTGVFNRNAMNNRVDGITAEEDPERAAAIVFADLNGLKHINDSEGHFAGDDVLKKAADILKAEFPDCEIFRAGGDEFMILALDLPGDVLRQRVENIHRAADKTEGVCFAAGLSIGRVGDIYKMMHEADVRMYEDKKRYYVMHPERKRT